MAYTLALNTAGTAAFDLRLYHVSDPTTAVGTAAGNFYAYYSAQNDAGDLYWTHDRGASSQTLYKITRTGNTPVATNMGTATNMPFGGWYEPLHLTHDGTQFVTGNGSDIYGITTATAGSAYFTSLAGLGHSGGRAIAAPAANRFLAFCTTHTAVELWDGPNDTLLDSVNDAVLGSFFNYGQWSPAGADRTFVAAQTSGTAYPREYTVGVLDSAGDALTWAWGPTTQVTDWNAGSGDAAVATWGGAAVFMDGEGSPSGGTVSAYIVDTTTGAVTASAATSTYAGVGVLDESIGFAGADYVVAFHLGWKFSIWDAAAVPPDPVYPRPIGKSLHLRQRQTPYIT